MMKTAIAFNSGSNTGNLASNSACDKPGFIIRDSPKVSHLEAGLNQQKAKAARQINPRILQNAPINFQNYVGSSKFNSLSAENSLPQERR
jgi:hypothetical protein